MKKINLLAALAAIILLGFAACDNKTDDPLGFCLAYSIYTITDTVPEKDEWIELKWY